MYRRWKTKLTLYRLYAVHARICSSIKVCSARENSQYKRGILSVESRMYSTCEDLHFKQGLQCKGRFSVQVRHIISTIEDVHTAHARICSSSTVSSARENSQYKRSILSVDLRMHSTCEDLQFKQDLQYKGRFSVQVSHSISRIENV